MNPGTLIFLVLGLIGLLIYVSKAIKPSKSEGFTVVDESQISNKGRDGLEKLKEGALNFETLFSAFSTPDVNFDRASNLNMGVNPTLPEFSNKTDHLPPPSQPPPPSPPPPPPTITTPPLPTPQLPLPPQQPVISKTPALPVLTPASIINMPDTNKAPARPITISDMQGSILPKLNLPIRESYRSYKRKKPKKRRVVYKKAECPPMPDMSQYIRKDSIPCWGCNLK